MALVLIVLILFKILLHPLLKPLKIHFSLAVFFLKMKNYKCATLALGYPTQGRVHACDVV